MPDKDNLDLLLDSALATYADPGPDSGLEQRLLTALEAERQSARIRTAAPWSRRWLPWAIAIPLAASLLLWIGLAKFSRAPSTQQQASQSRPSPRVGPDSQPPAHSVEGRHDFSHAANRANSRRAFVSERRLFTAAKVQNHEPLPKLAVFPSPQPLTAEERVLVATATRGSEAQRTALVEAAKPPSDAPLAIADLSIPPLVLLDEGTK